MRVIEQEVSQGLQEYRDTLLETFAGVPTSVDPEWVRQELAADGWRSDTPVVVIPYTQEHIRAALEVNNATDWQAPYVADLFDEVLELRERLDAGEVTDDTTRVTSFCDYLLDLVVTFDTYDALAPIHGETFAVATRINAIGHELGHAAFAHLTQITMESRGGEEVLIKERGGVSQADNVYSVEPGDYYLPEAGAVYLEEGVAVHAASTLQRRLVPESLPEGPVTEDMRIYGIRRLTLPPHYFFHSEAQPYAPTAMGWAIAGYGLEVLAQKHPDVIDKIKQVADGRLAVADFHDDLHTITGTNLYNKLVEFGDYRKWGKVLKALNRL